MNSRKDLLKTLIDLLDGIVEVFLSTVIEPLLVVYNQLDQAIDRCLKQFLQQYKDQLFKCILQDSSAITYARIGLAIPTIVLLSWQRSLVASLVVCVVLSASFWERAVPDVCFDHCEQGGEDRGDEGEEESFGKYVFVRLARRSCEGFVR